MKILNFIKCLCFFGKELFGINPYKSTENSRVRPRGMWKDLILDFIFFLNQREFQLWRILRMGRNRLDAPIPLFLQILG